MSLNQQISVTNVVYCAFDTNIGNANSMWPGDPGGINGPIKMIVNMTLPRVCQLAGVTWYLVDRRQHVTNTNSRAHCGSKLRGHVNITNGHYILSTIHKTPVKNHKFHTKTSICWDCVFINNQEMLFNLLFEKNYNTHDVAVWRMNASYMHTIWYEQ